MKVEIKVTALNAGQRYWDSDKVERTMEISIDDDQALMKMLRTTQTIGAAVSTMAVAAVNERIVLRDAPPIVEEEEGEIE